MVLVIQERDKKLKLQKEDFLCPEVKIKTLMYGFTGYVSVVIQGH
jgi:hypothetical protein